MVSLSRILILSLRAIIGISIILVLILALINPVAFINKNGIYDNLYVNKECVGISGVESACADIDSKYKQHLTAIYGIYISIIGLIAIYILAKISNYKLIKNIIGLIIFGLSITLIVMLPLILNFHRNNLYYKLSNLSIMVIVSCSILIIDQLIFNKIIYSIF
jgi:hypothetical protein